VISTCADAMTGASSALPAILKLKISAFPPFFIFKLLQDHDDKPLIHRLLKTSTLGADRRLTPPPSL
jgi:hypothetical protein